jgi:hypothetical protein
MLAELGNAAWMGTARASAGSDGLFDMLTAVIAASTTTFHCHFSSPLLGCTSLYFSCSPPYGKRHVQDFGCLGLPTLAATVRPNAVFVVLYEGPATALQFGYPSPEIVGREFDTETAFVTSPLKAVVPFIERHSTSPFPPLDGLTKIA